MDSMCQLILYTVCTDRRKIRTVLYLRIVAYKININSRQEKALNIQYITYVCTYVYGDITIAELK